MGGSELDSTTYLAAGMAAFFAFFVVQFGVTGLLEERQQGTMPRLLAPPIRPGAIHLGKVGGAFVLGVASMSVLAVASTVLLDADWGRRPAWPSSWSRWCWPPLACSPWSGASRRRPSRRAISNR